MAVWDRALGTAATAAAAVVAGAAAGLVAERVVVGRSVRARGEPQFGLGQLRGPYRIVTADDGAQLYVEVDEPGPRASWPELTVVFCHGFALNLDSWHFQREALRGRARLVFWDQRGHGRSGRNPGAPVSIEELGHDLGQILDEVAPGGPVVLVGHSMGGMTVMALAADQPERFGTSVVGAVLVGTSSGELHEVTLGAPTPIAEGVRRIAPSVIKLARVNPMLAERGRRAGSDFARWLTLRYGFASKVPAEIVDFAAELIEATSVDVLADYYPVLQAHEATASLSVFSGVATLVIVGRQDHLTPVSHSLAIAEGIAGSHVEVLDPGGHLVMLERPDDVDAILDDFLEQVAGRPATDRAS
jgi:pimeloyl-ACP methyl ester carboxylesterase